MGLLTINRERHGPGAIPSRSRGEHKPIIAQRSAIFKMRRTIGHRGDFAEDDFPGFVGREELVIRRKCEVLPIPFTGCRYAED